MLDPPGFKGMQKAGKGESGRGGGEGGAVEMEAAHGPEIGVQTWTRKCAMARDSDRIEIKSAIRADLQ